MQQQHLGIQAVQGPGHPLAGTQLQERYHNQLVPQGLSAEMIAEKWGISREWLDQISYDSHMRAARATVMQPDSSGSRKASRVRRSNSGNSSRNSTPW